jgi:signal transducing adaptor molecule
MSDDFTQLNEKFIKARRDYESLLEASMTQPQQPAYGGRPFSGYNAPPPSNYNGYPPSSTPQQDPRYGYSGVAPPQQAPPYLPAGPNPAFFMVPPSGEQPPQQHTSKPAATSDPYALPQGRVPVSGRPQSFAPQELATSHFDSPVDNRQSYVAPGQSQGYDHPPSQQQAPPGYPPQQGAPPQGQQNPYDQISSPPPQQQPPSDPYSQVPPQAGYGYPPQQPGHAPPAPPAASSSPPPAQGYLPYRPPGQGPSAPPVGGDEGFYR